MDEVLGKFERIRLTKPKRVIDASVILETVFETDFCCTNYIKNAGFDYQAFITIPLLGETILKIISKLSKAPLIKEKVFDLVSDLIQSERLHIIPHNTSSDEIFRNLQISLSIIPRDDLLHIAEIITSGFNEFVTIDTKISKDSAKRVLHEQFKLKVINPKQK